MITFKKTEDIQKLAPGHEARPIITELVTSLITAYTKPGEKFDWQSYGYVMLAEEGDQETIINNISHVMFEPPASLLEGVTREDNFLIAIQLLNNECGWVYVIPDQPWIDGQLRTMLEYCIET